MIAAKRVRGVEGPTVSNKIEIPHTSGLSDDALLATQEEAPQGWSTSIDELLRIRNLEEDWDGVGAKAPPTATVDSAIRLAQILKTQQQGILWRAAPCRVVPGRTGTVIFEWQVGSDYHEIEVISPGHG